MLRSCFQHLYDLKRKRIVMPDIVTLRLNRGERPEPLTLPVQAAISNELAFKLSSLQQYPSYKEFYGQLSVHTEFDASSIVVGAGIEDFIRTLMFLCCDPGQKAAVLWPTCAMYDIYAEAFSVDLVRIKPTPGIEFLMSSFMNQLPSDVKLVFVPNPGQPVETYFTNDQLRALADYCLSIGAVLAIDEAHWGFGAESAFPLVADYENLLVMRTFSKFYGAASIRVGYAVGQKELISALHAVRPSGEIAGPSMAIASILLSHTSAFVKNARDVVEARDWLCKAIKRRGFDAWGKYGFSVLIELPSVTDVEAVAEGLKKYGVLVKSGFPPPVDRCIMLACGSMDIARRFLAHFEQVACNDVVYT